MSIINNNINKEEVQQLAEEISFRLLATRKHPEHEWLIKRLDKVINEKRKKGDIDDKG